MLGRNGTASVRQWKVGHRVWSDYIIQHHFSARVSLPVCVGWASTTAAAALPPLGYLSRERVIQLGREGRRVMLCPAT
jgi:hypothetical protein